MGAVKNKKTIKPKKKIATKKEKMANAKQLDQILAKKKFCCGDQVKTILYYPFVDHLFTQVLINRALTIKNK